MSSACNTRLRSKRTRKVMFNVLLVFIHVIINIVNKLYRFIFILSCCRWWNYILTNIYSLPTLWRLLSSSWHSIYTGTVTLVRILFIGVDSKIAWLKIKSLIKKYGYSSYLKSYDNRKMKLCFSLILEFQFWQKNTLEIARKK